jgi:hypothetical protein
MTLTGSGFLPGVAVMWNGSYRTTSLVNSNQVDYFPTILHKEDLLVDEAVLVLSKTLQCLFDILHDATQDSQDGPAKIAILGLSYWLFDELTVAQYLARRNYSTLAYTHLRSVMEILDKIELFTQKPENAELWTSGNESEIWTKLSPARVRELLGRIALILSINTSQRRVHTQPSRP